MRPLFHLSKLGVKRLQKLGLHTLIILGIASGAAILFAALASQVLQGNTTGLDHALNTWAKDVDSPMMDTIMRTVTFTGNGQTVFFFAAFVAAALFAKRAIKTGVVFLLVAIFAGVLNTVLKILFGRERPTLFAEVTLPDSFSFPSGHAMISTAVYGMAAIALARLSPRLRPFLWVAAPLWIVLIGLSRVYLGVHWATDVLAGFAVGSILVVAGWLSTRAPIQIPVADESARS